MCTFVFLGWGGGTAKYQKVVSLSHLRHWRYLKRCIGHMITPKTIMTLFFIVILKHVNTIYIAVMSFELNVFFNMLII